MSDDSFQQEVLDELGDHRLQEIADALDTDTGAAAAVVGTSVSTLSGELKDAAETPGQAGEVRDALGEPAEPPLQGAVTLGGGLGGGLMAGVPARLARPAAAAAAAAKRTGMPVATVSKAFELLIPVVLTVLTRRALTAGPRGRHPARRVPRGPVSATCSAICWEADGRSPDVLARPRGRRHLRARARLPRTEGRVRPTARGARTASPSPPGPPRRPAPTALR
ncbi:hypothetical protein [Streptomyces sp. NPDC007988]|uniref:hypothetical protein n=1 Tax=Streptomyces sp. NPDC007988 TaxID=3364802 RepID=UPI0036F09FFB